METAAAIGMVVASGVLLALFAAAARGLRLPDRLFRPRTWKRAIGWTVLFGAAATIGGVLAAGTTVAGIAAVATAFLVALELALWSDAFAFGPRDR